MRRRIRADVHLEEQPEKGEGGRFVLIYKAHEIPDFGEYDRSRIATSGSAHAILTVKCLFSRRRKAHRVGAVYNHFADRHN